MNNRIEKLLKNLNGSFGASLITKAENIFYFLGIDTQGAGTLLLFDNNAYFIIDSRYIEIAQNTVKNASVILQNKLYSQINDILIKHGLSSVMLEQGITLQEYNALKTNLANISLDISNTLTAAINNCRMVKDENELNCIFTAQHITDKAFLHMLNFLKPGKTEKECALELDYFMLKNGAEGLAFPTILISGQKTSMPHGIPGDNILQSGDFVTMDFGARYGGYCTDMTRTVALSYATDEMQKVYLTVQKAQHTAAAAVKANCIGSKIDKIARDIINNEGYEQYFGHALGHSVGIEIHEEPRFSPNYNAKIPCGAVMTVEPGIYLPGKFGVRIEDTVIVQKNGCRIEGTTDKNLIILK